MKLRTSTVNAARIGLLALAILAIIPTMASAASPSAVETVTLDRLYQQIGRAIDTLQSSDDPSLAASLVVSQAGTTHSELDAIGRSLSTLGATARLAQVVGRPVADVQADLDRGKTIRDIVVAAGVSPEAAIAAMDAFLQNLKGAAGTGEDDDDNDLGNTSGNAGDDDDDD
ncbi:MAG: hypothetical protein KDD47_28495, partial [Acidobacteria bacterium]|nr:hypothetical protein [Acidobacteriota bacterium]